VGLGNILLFCGLLTAIKNNVYLNIGPKSIQLYDKVILPLTFKFPVFPICLSFAKCVKILFKGAEDKKVHFLLPKVSSPHKGRKS
jgi:hypothetical protein